MPKIKVVLKNGDDKTYDNAEAYIDANKILHILRSGGTPDRESLIAEFQSEAYGYWEQTQ